MQEVHAYAEQYICHMGGGCLASGDSQIEFLVIMVVANKLGRRDVKGVDGFNALNL